MKRHTRRSFIKTSILAGGATIIGSQLMPKFLHASFQTPFPDIVTIAGNDPLKAIPKLLEQFGGIGNFIKTGNSVGILINSPWKNPGTYTHPDIPLSVIKLCLDAGAKEIVVFKSASAAYWERGNYSTQFEAMIKKFKYSSERKEVDIPGGVALKKATIFKDFLETDIFISVPVAKHHAGVLFSGNLKGLMGVSSGETNRYMHSPKGDYNYDEHEYLAQCIADLNLLRKPDLCIVDATECVLSNGPAGPGDTVKPNKIIAGIDPVALDVYAATLIGFSNNDILTFDKARKLGIGETDISKLTIKEI